MGDRLSCGRRRWYLPWPAATLRRSWYHEGSLLRGVTISRDEGCVNRRGPVSGYAAATSRPKLALLGREGAPQRVRVSQELKGSRRWRKAHRLPAHVTEQVNELLLSSTGPCIRHDVPSSIGLARQ